MRRNVLLAVVLLGMTANLEAAHLNSFDSVDAIDHVFSAGGGTFIGSITTLGNNSYSVFAANAGDVITIDVEGATSGQGTLVDPILVLFQAVNGVVEVGDLINVFDFNEDQVGNGVDLVVLAFDDDSGTGPLDSRLASFVIPASGQFAIGVASFNNEGVGDFRVTLSGNTADVTSVDPTPIPEPASLAVFGVVGLVGLSCYRRRRQQQVARQG